MMPDEQLARLGRQNTEFAVGEVVPGTKYLVVSQIGQGGMGSVYEVEHVELGKRFVLKALLDQFCQRQDLVQRLRNEWRSLGRLEHPHIVSVSDAGVAANGAPYYVMERLYGESLAGALGRLGRFSLEDSLRIAAEVLEGLGAAHEIGIVHRDVKPPNIFVTQSGIAKLLDFGIAKLTDGASVELTGRGIAIGTPRYMSPEQAAGERVDGRADLYAVGLVMFEMLSGCGPFDGCESHEVFLAHLTRQPPRLGELVAGIPSELDDFVATLLAKRPADRPQTAGEAAACLRAMLHHYTLPSYRPPASSAEFAAGGETRSEVPNSGAVGGWDVNQALLSPEQMAAVMPPRVPPLVMARPSVPPEAPEGAQGAGLPSHRVSQPPSRVPSVPAPARPSLPPEVYSPEPTPSGFWRAASSHSARRPGGSVPPPTRSKRHFALVAGVIAAAGLAGWLLTQPDVPEVNLAAATAPQLPAEPIPSAPAVPSVEPPALGVIIGGNTSAVVAPSPSAHDEVDKARRGAGGSATGRSSVAGSNAVGTPVTLGSGARLRRTSAELEVPASAEDSTESETVPKSFSPVRVPAATAPSATPQGAVPVSQPSRPKSPLMPGSGIGSGG
jgi:serine/threonine protein kinase